MTHIFQIKHALCEFTYETFETETRSITGYNLFVDGLYKYIESKIKDEIILEHTKQMKLLYTISIVKGYPNPNTDHFINYLAKLNDLIQRDIPEINEFFIKWFKIDIIR